MKRLLAIVGIVTLALLLVPGGMVLAGSAGYEPPAPANPLVDVPPGATGSIAVSISGTNIGSFTLEISCDSSVINFTGITPGDLALAYNITGPGSASISWFSVTPTSGGSVATINYTAVGNPGDSTAINGNFTQIVDPNGDPTTGTVTCNPDTVTIIQIYTLTMAVSPSGSGDTDPGVGTHTYSEGEVVDISATPQTGYEFGSWTGDVANPNSASTTVTMDGDKTVTANFNPVTTFILTIAVNPTGGGNTTPGVGTHIYNEGQEVSIVAIPNEGYEFSGWTGDAVENPNSASTAITMDSNKTVTANFTLATSGQTYNLTIAVSPPGRGTTSPPTGTLKYTEGQVVPISATPTSGWQFDSWTGDVANPNSASTTATMDADKTVTANFTQTGTVDTTPPLCTNITATNITQTGAQIRWTTDEPADTQVEYWASPGDFTTLNPTLLTSHIVSLTGLEPETTYHYKVMSRDGAGNLTVSGEQTFVTASAGGGGVPAYFGTSQWDLAVTEATEGKTFTISHVVINMGELPGTYQVSLSLNGVEIDSKEIILSAGESQTVSFNANVEDVGEYTAVIGDTTLLFSVEEAATTGTGSGDWITNPLFLGGLLLWHVIVAAILYVSFIRWRRRYTLSPAGISMAQPARPSTVYMPSRTLGQDIVPKRPTSTPPEFDTGRSEVESKQESDTVPERPVVAPWADEAGHIEGESGSSSADEILVVTDRAAEKLRESLKSKATEPGIAFRVTSSSTTPIRVKMALDTQQPDDAVIISEGLNIIYMSPETVRILEGVTIDFQETEHGGTFTLSKKHLPPR
ncbi:fibronectin type III domain-containing protein [Chloroflexota bacterium]